MDYAAHIYTDLIWVENCCSVSNACKERRDTFPAKNGNSLSMRCLSVSDISFECVVTCEMNSTTKLITIIIITFVSIVCLFGVFRSTQEFFTHMET